MSQQADFFPETLPITFIRDTTAFTPRVIEQAPIELRALPEETVEEKILKTRRILKWLMANYRSAWSFSSGKDSSCVMGLAMAAAAELGREGIAVRDFVIMSADTLVDNPAVHAVMYQELSKLREWIDRHNLPGKVHIAKPYLSDQFAVNVIGGRSLPSTAQTQRDCTIGLKVLPLTRLRKAVLGKNNLKEGRFVVSVSGVRFSESPLRAANMALRRESPDSLVITNAEGNVALAPIARWSWDDVFHYLGLANNGLETTYSDFSEVIRIYREAMGECVILGSDDDIKASRPCSARTGCWNCLMIENDKSMDFMIEEPANAYMRPLAQLRTFLSNTFFDLTRRTWIGRSIDEHGYVKFAPDVYSPAQTQDLLRYALTIQFDEYAAARRLGIAPRFSLVSLEALIAIDALWSLQGLALPFTGLRIYRDVLHGARYPVPDTPVFPKVEIPAARYIYVGADWNQGQPWSFTGLRDVLAEAFAGDGCMGTRQINAAGGCKTIMDVRTELSFNVDAESAAMIMEFELDRLVDEWHGQNARAPLALEGFHVAGIGYRFYASYGAINLARGHEGRTDEILRRTAFRERVGLAGYQFDFQRALERSVETTETLAHSVSDAMERVAA